MARTNEASSHGIPAPPDVEGWRHFGDGLAGRIVAARLQGFNSADGDYRDVAVDANGVVQTAGSGGGGAVTQATTPWVVDGSAVTQPVSAAALPLPSGAATSARQDSQTTLLGAGLPATLDTGSLKVSVQNASVAVAGTFWQATQPVSLASVPSHDVTQATASSLNAAVVGNVASGATDSGNPVKAGGKYSVTPATLTDAQRGDLLLDSRQKLGVYIGAKDALGSWTLDNAGGDGKSDTNTVGVIQGRGYLFNNTTWDRWRGDTTSGAYVQTKAEVATATDGTGALPGVVKVIGGYDGTVVHALSTRVHDGVAMLQTNDQKVRQELEHIHVLLIEQIDLTRLLVGERADLN
jgi:hypothetical protein